MEEGLKNEVEMAVTEANSPDEEMKNEMKVKTEEQMEREISDEKKREPQEVVKQNEVKEKTDDERVCAAAKEEVVENDGNLKSQTTKERKDKELSKKAPISSFFGEEEFA